MSPMSRLRRNSLASAAYGSDFSSRRPIRGARMLDRNTRRSVPAAASLTTRQSPLTTCREVCSARHIMLRSGVP